MVKFFLFFVVFSIQSYAQTIDHRYTQGAENGYTWIMLKDVPTKLTDNKQQYLSSMLENQRYTNQNSGKTKFPLGCREDISKVGRSDIYQELELDDMVKMVDDFYTVEENLIIPIMGAYCYSVKYLAGVTDEELEKYRQDLLAFSKRD